MVFVFAGLEATSVIFVLAGSNQPTISYGSPNERSDRDREMFDRDHPEVVDLLMKGLFGIIQKSLIS